MAGRKSKDKGGAYERELCKQAKDNGLTAKKAWSSNGRSLGLPEGVDCVIDGVPVQAKRRAKLPLWLQPPEGAEAVVIREDYGKSWVLIPWSEWMRMRVWMKKT